MCGWHRKLYNFVMCDRKFVNSTLCITSRLLKLSEQRLRRRQDTTYNSVRHIKMFLKFLSIVWTDKKYAQIFYVHMAVVINFVEIWTRTQYPYGRVRIGILFIPFKLWKHIYKHISYVYYYQRGECKRVFRVYVIIFHHKTDEEEVMCGSCCYC